MKVITKQQLIQKYEKELETFVVMDDYDAGVKHTLKNVLHDLRSTLNSAHEKELDY